MLDKVFSVYIVKLSIGLYIVLIISDSSFWVFILRDPLLRQQTN